MIIFPVFKQLLIEITSFKPLVSTIIGPLLPAMVSILKPHLFPHKFYSQLPLSTYDWAPACEREATLKEGGAGKQG